MEPLRFTIPEIISLLGVCQCVYVLVYILFRTQNVKAVLLPVLYFFVLGAAFFSDFARSYVQDMFVYYDVVSWGLWASSIPVSVLLVLQISKITHLPPLSSWSVLFIIPMALYISLQLTQSVNAQDCDVVWSCQAFIDWLNVSGVVGGALSLLVIWGYRDVFNDILKQKAGKERYWLILSLIIVNVILLVLVILHTAGWTKVSDHTLLRTVLGLTFTYLVSTSLFRIYPNALHISYKGAGEASLTDEDRRTIEKIDNLLAFDKIYHETSYSRTDLARELDISESALSRIINVHYQKSFPMLLNEHRIEDAKRLLIQTDAEIKIVAEEVGFNSLASFNRVFKNMVSQSPSEYRKNTIA